MRFTIRGYDVEFPHQPYGVQFSFMEKMLRTLDEQGNALLEAPTGCGKTLSLLCAALAWQTKRKKDIAELAAARLTRSGVRGSESERQQRRAGAAAKAQGTGKAPTGGAYGLAACCSSDDDDNDFKPAGDRRRTKKQRTHDAKAAPDSSPSATGSPGATDSPPGSGGSRGADPGGGKNGGEDDDHGAFAGAFGDRDEDDADQEPPKLPKIFFATRTHSQIAQVVRELKRSGYKPSMAILAAKQHYCINNAVKRTGRVDEECERLMKEEAHGCRFRAGKGASRGGRPPPDVGVHDIEELSKSCARAKQCPYFAARDLALTADLVFCPYSYLLDPLVRAALGIDVGGSVLIFDEAHNMEDVCREGASMDLDLDALREVEVSFRLAAQLTGRPELYSPLAEAVGRLGALLGRFEGSTEGMAPAGFEQHEAVWQGPRALSLLDEAGLSPSPVSELHRLYDGAKAYEEKATFATDGDAVNEAIPASVTRPGAGGAALATLGRLLTVLRLMYAPAPPPPQPPPQPQPAPSVTPMQPAHHHRQTPQPPNPQLPQQQHQRPPQQQPYLKPGGTAAAGGAGGGPSQMASASTTAAAGGFIPTGNGVGGGGFIPTGGGGFIPGGGGGRPGGPGTGGAGRVPLVGPCRDNSGDYRVVVKRWIAHGAKDRRKARSRLRRDDGDDGGAAVGPGAAVSLGLWCFNPAMAFRNLADKAHSVVLTSGTLAPLDSFASELGTEFHVRLEAPHVVDMSRQVWAGVVPRGPGGNLLSATFRESGTFSFQDDAGEAVLRYCQVIPDGVLLFMPSYSLLEKLMTRWKSTGLWERLEGVKSVVVEPREAGKGFEDAMAKYYAAVRSGKGGLFLAVCRGKASEGIDFADQHARGVILLGIPFPAVKDTKVKLKKEYNDAGCGPSSGRPPSQRLLSGDAWYNQQAFRALNQAVGRCIRHKYDWGAIILLDERFRGNTRQQQLSRWVRAAVKVHEDFNRSLFEVEAFCKGLQADPPRPPPPQDPAEASGSGASGTSTLTTAHAAGVAATAIGSESRKLGPFTVAAAAAAEKATSSWARPQGGGRMAKVGGKGSVDLQYEDDVVPPDDQGRETGGKGGGGGGPFDRFRLPAATSTPGVQKAATAGGVRTIASFFPPAAAVQQQQLQQQQQQLTKFELAGASVGGCCGGDSGGDGGGGGPAASGGGAYAAPGPQRPYGSVREPMQCTQQATQQYHAPLPVGCGGGAVRAAPCRSVGHAPPPEHHAQHRDCHQHQRGQQTPQQYPQQQHYQQYPQHPYHHQQQHHQHGATCGLCLGDTAAAGAGAMGGGLFAGGLRAAASPEAVRPPPHAAPPSQTPVRASPAMQPSYQSPQLAQVPHSLATTPLGHQEGGQHVRDPGQLQQRPSPPQLPPPPPQQLQSPQPSRPLQQQLHRPMQPPPPHQQQQLPQHSQAQQPQPHAQPPPQQQHWHGQQSAGCAPKQWQGMCPPPPQSQQQQQQGWHGQGQQGQPPQQQQQAQQLSHGQQNMQWRRTETQPTQPTRPVQQQPPQHCNWSQQMQQQHPHQHHHYQGQQPQPQEQPVWHPPSQPHGSQARGTPLSPHFLGPFGAPPAAPAAAPLPVAGPQQPDGSNPPRWQQPGAQALQQSNGPPGSRRYPGGDSVAGAGPTSTVQCQALLSPQGHDQAWPQQQRSLLQQPAPSHQQQLPSRPQWQQQQQQQQQQPPSQQRQHAGAYGSSSGAQQARPEDCGTQATGSWQGPQPPQEQAQPQYAQHILEHQHRNHHQPQTAQPTPQQQPQLPLRSGWPCAEGGARGSGQVGVAPGRRDALENGAGASAPVSMSIVSAVAARPTKRLTSGRAREAAMKRQRLQRPNGMGDSGAEDADGSGWGEFEDDTDDFVSC